MAKDLVKMKTVDLHRNQLKKQIEKLEDKSFEIGHRNVIIRSDSKGRSLMPFFTNTNRINLIYRSGGSITNNRTNSFMQDYTLNRIKTTPNPLVILFFGTCELTVKNGKYITIPTDLDGRVQEVIEQYYIYKQTILEYNPSATVIYLDCPYFSLIQWNFLKGHPSPGGFEPDQKRLETAILSFNKKLRDINGARPVPRLALDFIYSTKKKDKQLIKLRNYGLLTDGVHAGRFISKLWALRIARMISLN